MNELSGLALTMTIASVLLLLLLVRLVAWLWRE